MSDVSTGADELQSAPEPEPPPEAEPADAEPAEAEPPEAEPSPQSRTAAPSSSPQAARTPPNKKTTARTVMIGLRMRADVKPT